MDLIGDVLRSQVRELDSLFYVYGIFDPDAWQVLAGEFEEAGRVAGAADVRERAVRIAVMAAAQSVSA